MFSASQLRSYRGVRDLPIALRGRAPMPNVFPRLLPVRRCHSAPQFVKFCAIKLVSNDHS